MLTGINACLRIMPLKVKTTLVEFDGLICPFRAGVFGSTRTGKTTLIYNILKRLLDIIIVCLRIDNHDKPS